MLLVITSPPNSLTCQEEKMFISTRRMQKWNRILHINRSPFSSRTKSGSSIKAKNYVSNTINYSEIVASVKKEQTNGSVHKTENYVKQPYVMGFLEQKQVIFTLL
jgi:hypothetical protein